VTLYVDTSALVKLVRPERESPSVHALLGADPSPISSALARLELERALRRQGLWPEAQARCEAIFARLSLTPIDAPVLELARSLEPADLRSLDAIHLASALSLPARPQVLTYDVRLAEACRNHALTVLSPA
jgi:uncharacterized protein